MLKVRVVVQIQDSRSKKLEENTKSNKDVCESTPKSNSKTVVKASEPVDPQLLNAPLMLAKRAEVKLIDFTTLNLLINNGNESQSPEFQKMSFDYITPPTEDLLKTEISSLMDEMLVQRRNCCLVVFNTQRASYLRRLYKLLVADVNRLLEQLQVKVDYIKIKYNDIRSEGVFDILNWPEQLPAVLDTFKLQYSSNYCQYANTSELFVWLMNNFGSGNSRAEGHDAIEFVFRIIGQKEKTYELKLNVFHVHLDKLNENDFAQWQKYMGQLGKVDKVDNEGVEQNVFEFTPLTFCLHTFMGGKETSKSGRTLLVFNVPTDEELASQTKHVLQMAHSVMKNRKMLYLAQKLKRRISEATTSTPTSITNEKQTSTQLGNNDDLNDTPIQAPQPHTQTRSGGISFTIPVSPVSYSESCCKRRRMSNVKYTKKDLQELHTWYTQIDLNFNTLSIAMDEYFDVLAQQHYHCFSAAMRHLQHNADLEAITQSSREGSMDGDRLDSVDYMQMQEFHMYQAAFNNFMQIKNDVQNLQYAEALDVYWETTHFELMRRMLSSKMKLFEKLKQRMDEVFTEDLNVLNAQFNEND